MRRKPEGNDIMLLAVFKELIGMVGPVSIEEQEACVAYPSRACSSIKVLKPFETE